MHIPVLLCGFLCGWPWGLAVGFVAPLLRSVLFGMPPIYPTGVAMMPGIPNGFVPYAASHTKITVRQFSVAVFLGSLIQIFIMCSIGSRIMSGDYAVSFFLVLAMLGLIFLLYRVKNRLVGIFEQYQKTKRSRSIADKH